MTEETFNPFFHRGLIQDPRYFVGRTSILNELLGMISHNQSCSIVGPRKIGKSSLLCQLLFKLRSGKDNLIAVFIDSLQLADTSKSQFWAVLLRAVQAQLVQQGITGEGTEVLERRLRQQDDKLDVRHVAEVFDALKNQGVQTVLLFDEFEHLIDNLQLGPIFFGEFRSIIGGTFDTCVVTVSQKGLFELTYSEDLRASPFFNIFNQYRVGLFDRSETEQLLCALLGVGHADGMFDQAGQELIRELAGDHPFFLQLAAYSLFEQKRGTDCLTDDGRARVREDFFVNAESHFRYIWQTLSLAEKGTVQQIAVSSKVDLTRNLLTSLKRKAVVVVVDSHPALFSPAFGEFAGVQKPPAQADRVTEIGISGQYDLEIQYGRDHLTIRLRGGEISTIEEGRYISQDIQSYNVRIQEVEKSPLWRRKSRYVGTALFRDIVTNIPTIAKNYWYARGLVGTSAATLKLVFIGDRDFIGLPIEFLRAEEDWLALQHPIVRRISSVPRSRMPICPDFIGKMRLQDEILRILLIASNTQPDIPGVDTEISILNELLPSLADEAGLKVEILCIPTKDASLEKVQSVLKDCEFHILHYAGHGYYDENRPDDSGILFWQRPDKASNVMRVESSKLRNWLKGARVRFAYFSCCYGSTTGPSFWLHDGDFLGILDSVIKSGVPAALGFRWPASDQGAINLARSFYYYLFSTFSIDEALFRAKCDIAEINVNDPTWASPIVIVQ